MPKNNLGGRRGASSSSKQYTIKDIKKNKDSIGSITYELNGWYLYKDTGWSTKNNSSYNWVVAREKNYSTPSAESKARNNKELFYVNNYKEGKNRLIELANKKRK